MRDLWIFGYGSLMWRPGFEHAERSPALLHGAHRSLCVYSVVHRGTQDNPGLVLGLDAGGSCRGMAFRVEGSKASRTLDYLREREQVTMVYVEARRAVSLLDGSGRRVRAVCYMVDRNHPQYAGKIPLTEQARLVRESEGASGHNIEYVANTLRHLDEMGLHEPMLSELLEMVTPDVTTSESARLPRPTF